MTQHKDRYKITIMGCGNSAGTPTIGNYWGNCDPDNPKNRRMRPSVAIQSGDKSLIIDTGADFKEQINLYNIDNIRGVLYTHAHSDHIAGIDELRVLRLRNKEHINIYSIADTIDELERRFDYMFVQKAKIYPQVLKSNILTPDDLNKTMDIDGIKFIPFEQDHGTCRTLGFRFGDIAYSTDMVRLPESSFDELQGIKTWVVDAAGYKMESNLVHATLRDVIAMNERIGAKKIYLTHLTPSMDYDRLMNELPDGFEPAYDGLVFDIGA